MYENILEEAIKYCHMESVYFLFMVSIQDSGTRGPLKGPRNDSILTFSDCSGKLFGF